MNTANSRTLLLTCFRSIQTMGAPLNFHFTPVLSAEPLKKRKRIDPALVREKAEKKMRRLARDIRRLEKIAKKLKPLAELEISKKIMKESNRQRVAPVLSEDEIQKRADLEKEWAHYRRNQHVDEINAINRMIVSQERAMDALKEASTELYEQALQVDPILIPFQMTGPVRTPPIEDFDCPEGAYIDVTKQYLPIVPIEIKKKKGKINANKK